MGIKCADDPFNMGMFFNLRRPSKWVHFKPPTQTSGHFILGSPPWDRCQVGLYCPLIGHRERFFEVFYLVFF